MVTKEEREREIQSRKKYEAKALEDATKKAIARDLFKAEDVLTSASKIHVAVFPELEASFKFSRLNYEETKILGKQLKDLEPADRAVKTIAAMIEKANPELRGTVEATLNGLTPNHIALITQRMNEVAPPPRFLPLINGRKP